MTLAYLICRDCGGPRFNGHTYCSKCADSRTRKIWKQGHITEYKNHRERILKRNREYRNRPEVKELMKQKGRATRYNLTQEAYEGMRKDQEGKCRICKEEMHPICVDHDHATRTVRGLLCNRCNLGLGHFSTVALLAGGIAYLKGYPFTESRGEVHLDAAHNNSTARYHP